MNAQITIPFALRTDQLIGSVIDSSSALLPSQKHDIVRFAMGAPGEDLIPLAGLAAAYGTAKRGRYDYGESEGEPRLREQIRKLSAASGQATTAERVLLTSDERQRLHPASTLVVAPG